MLSVKKTVLFLPLTQESRWDCIYQALNDILQLPNKVYYYHYVLFSPGNMRMNEKSYLSGQKNFQVPKNDILPGK